MCIIKRIRGMSGYGKAFDRGSGEEWSGKTG